MELISNKNFLRTFQMPLSVYIVWSQAEKYLLWLIHQNAC